MGKSKGSGLNRARQNERIPRKAVKNDQARPRSFVPSASAPRGTWIKPQGKLETPKGVAAARGGLAINYRLRVAPQVPCYFIFGDSLVDNGNNNVLRSLARDDYLPYEIDFPDGPFDRFSNGKTDVD
ncbi:hypothetical protein KIW84_055444 [Lathyrus oleraceus]|uniref:Uncharacterized protein n=1 Tax=Pisum sativum TaxID=3888 RepID=A0A9D4WXZ2_PEA|nr:hypothetical protein KIW84_055444 [Pisum sativum]